MLVGLVSQQESPEMLSPPPPALRGLGEAPCLGAGSGRAAVRREPSSVGLVRAAGASGAPVAGTEGRARPEQGGWAHRAGQEDRRAAVWGPWGLGAGPCGASRAHPRPSAAGAGRCRRRPGRLGQTCALPAPPAHPSQPALDFPLPSAGTEPPGAPQAGAPGLHSPPSSGPSATRDRLGGGFWRWL